MCDRCGHHVSNRNSHPPIRGKPPLTTDGEDDIAATKRPDAAGPASPMPPGTYHAVYLESYRRRCEIAGAEELVVVFKISDGKFAGQVVHHRRQLRPVPRGKRRRPDEQWVEHYHVYVMFDQPSQANVVRMYEARNDI